jgi:uncharacterized protein DUF6876
VSAIRWLTFHGSGHAAGHVVPLFHEAPTMNKPKLTLGDLRQFTGGDEYYYLPMFRRWKYTEGVKYVAMMAGAYWLVEAIMLHQTSAKAKAEEFQVWTLTKPEGSASATLIMTDGNSDKPIIQQNIEFTDFPLDEIKFYMTNDVLYLPSEH